MTKEDRARLRAYRSVAEQAAKEFRDMIFAVISGDTVPEPEREALESAREDANTAVFLIQVAGSTIRRCYEP